MESKSSEKTNVYGRIKVLTKPYNIGACFRFMLRHSVPGRSISYYVHYIDYRYVNIAYGNLEELGRLIHQNLALTGE